MERASHPGQTQDGFAHRLNEEAERALAMLDALFAGAPIGLAFLDLNFRYVRINEVLAAFNGQSVQTHLGRTVREILPTHAEQLEGLLQEVLKSGSPVTGLDFAAATPGIPDQIRDWQINVYPARLQEGTFVGFGVAVVDVTPLKEAVRIREDLLSMAAHDLRAPLATMRLLAERTSRQLEQQTGGSDASWVVPKLHKIQQQVDRMTQLLNELLDVSRIQRAGLALEPADMNLADLVQEAASSHRELFEKAGSALIVDAPEPVWGRWDALAVEQVVSNLLTNAAKYGGGAPVEIRVTADATQASLMVRDYGVGIATENLERIFEQFARVGDRKAVPGTGLGLWIVKRFAEAMDGAVSAESTPGKGSTFTVRLPRQAPFTSIGSELSH